MINLLPPETAAAIRYGRQSQKISIWLLGVCAAIAGLVIILAVGWFYLNQESKRLQNNIESTNQQLKAQNLSKVQADAKEITGDIKVINQVLASEIRFSDLIQAIGNVMPSGSVLGSMSLNKVNGAIDLTASARDYATAAQVAVNLSDPKNNIFSKVDIVNISCTSAEQTYKCTANYRALFSSSVKTKFLSVPKASQ